MTIEQERELLARQVITLITAYQEIKQDDHEFRKFAGQERDELLTKFVQSYGSLDEMSLSTNEALVKLIDSPQSITASDATLIMIAVLAIFRGIHNTNSSPFQKKEKP